MSEGPGGKGWSNGATDLDSPERIGALRALINRKPALRHFYREIYRRYAECLQCSQAHGIALELGSGGGFAGECIPGLVTSDIIPYPGMDLVVDASRLPFTAGALRFIGMTNVFHHIPDAECFLREAERCLAPGGRLLIVDQHPGHIAGPLLKYFHHEPYDPAAAEWRFATTGPLSGANGALPWLVFIRDRARFNALFPALRLAGYRPHTPLLYWLAGGLKRWSLVPGRALGAVRALDRFLVSCSPQFGSFVDIEVVKIGN